MIIILSMDYREFKRIEEDRGTFFEDYIMKPFLYGITFGLGYYAAVLILEHPWSLQLLDFARSEASKKMLTSGVKEATSSAHQGTAVADEIKTAVTQGLPSA